MADCGVVIQAYCFEGERVGSEALGQRTGIDRLLCLERRQLIRLMPEAEMVHTTEFYLRI